jgi:hypothetical protein
MAIRPIDKYGALAEPADADYPEGSFKNASSPTAEDGSPLEKAWANDIYGLLQKIINAADITPSGVSDTVLASDYYNGLQRIFSGTTVFIDSGGANDYELISATGAFITSYVKDQVILFKATNTNTGSSTVEIDALGATPITNPDGTDLTASDILDGEYILLVRNDASSRFELIQLGGGPVIKPPKYSTEFNYGADNSGWLDDVTFGRSPHLRGRTVPISDTDHIVMRFDAVSMARARKSDGLASWTTLYSNIVVDAAKTIQLISAFYYDSVDDLIYCVGRDTGADLAFFSIDPATGASLFYHEILSSVSGVGIYQMMLDRVGGIEGTGDFLFTYKTDDSDDDTQFLRFDISSVTDSGSLETTDAFSPGSVMYYTADRKTIVTGLIVDQANDNNSFVFLYVRRGGNDRCIRIPLEYSMVGGVMDIFIDDTRDQEASFDLWAGDVAITTADNSTSIFSVSNKWGTSTVYFNRTDLDRWINEWCDHERMNPGVAWTL